MPVSRAEARKALATELTTALPTAQVVYDHMKGGFAGQSPVVRVMSAGSERRRFTPQGGRGELHFTVQFWVMYASPGNNWSEEDAENAIDQLEYELAEYVDSNRQGNPWKSLEYSTRSGIELVRLEGKPYLIEDVPIVMKVY